eukprot:365470-Chlamydomonas_euryale.AAC.3
MGRCECVQSDGCKAIGPEGWVDASVSKAMGPKRWAQRGGSMQVCPKGGVQYRSVRTGKGGFCLLQLGEG